MLAFNNHLSVSVFVQNHSSLFTVFVSLLEPLKGLSHQSQVGHITEAGGK